MKKVLLIYLVLIIGIITWYFTAGKEKRVLDDSKGVALEVTRHSLDFNRSIDGVMNGYYKMTDEFVKEDTLSINKTASDLKTALDSLKIQELQKDTSIYETAVSIWDNAKNELAGILGDPALQAKRQSLHHFSDQLYTFLNAIRFDLAKLYWMECSSAFGEDSPGNWISQSGQSKNPYGKADCATVKRVIDFATVDSTKK
jgi:Protein of unknown function (DUF3347)